MNILIRSSLISLAVATSIDAVAGRPLVTEDAGVLASGECEVETFASQLKARDEPKVSGWALAVEHETTPALSLMAETYATDRDRPAWVQVAVRWTLVPERLFVDGSWGFQTSGEHLKQITLGLKAAF